MNQIIESASKLYNSVESSAKITPRVVEIGVGLGDLSVRLLERFSLIAYEIDSELCGYFKDRFPKDRFTLFNEDVLKLQRQNGWLCDERYILVSNLPYYVATKIILNALKDKLCVGMVVMTQKEVAMKFCAAVGKKEFCALSVLTQDLSKNIHFIANVPPSAFIPAPKVESSIFSIEKNDNIFNADFERVLKMAFSSPRKMAIKNLDSISEIEAIFEILKIPKNARAHQISTQQYHQIFQNIIRSR